MVDPARHVARRALAQRRRGSNGICIGWQTPAVPCVSTITVRATLGEPCRAGRTPHSIAVRNRGEAPRQAHGEHACTLFFFSAPTARSLAGANPPGESRGYVDRDDDAAAHLSGLKRSALPVMAVARMALAAVRCCTAAGRQITGREVEAIDCMFRF